MKTLKKLTSMSFKPLMLFVLVTILLSSCKKDNTSQQSDSAELNVVNASPGTLAISFFVDNVFVNGPALNYTEQSGYLLSYTGQHKFDASAGGTNTSILTANLDLKKDLFYSLFVAGTNSSLTTVLTEDDQTLPSAGKVRIRFVQLSPDSPGLSLGIQGGATLFTNQAFKAVSTFTEINAGNTILEIKNGTTSVATFNVTLTAGKIYTAWSRGLASGSGTTALGISVAANN